jgi:hypothetical protein
MLILIFHFVMSFYIFCSLRFEDHQIFAGQGSKPTQASTKAPSANPTAQKPAAYRPPHAKTAAVIQAQVTFTESMICHRFFLIIIINFSNTYGITCI